MSPTLPSRRRVTDSARMLGWREWISLPGLGIPAIRAKIDTGARSSALHVEWQEEFLDAGVTWVRFGVRPDREDAVIVCNAEVIDRREVTDSSGQRRRRVFIRAAVALGEQTYPIEINLTSRHQMLFPMLLGRTALAGRWWVDPGKSFLLGR